MKRSDYKVARAFTGDVTRRNISGVRIEPGRLIACNGHVLIVVHETLNHQPAVPGEEPPTIANESVDTVIRGGPKNEVVAFNPETKEVVCGHSTTGIQTNNNPFPNYTEKLPKADKANIVVRLSAKYLKQLADAALLTHEGKEPHLDLFITTGFEPVRFEGYRLEGCIMPMSRD